MSDDEGVSDEEGVSDGRGRLGQMDTLLDQH